MPRPRIAIGYKHRSYARKQAAAERTAHARGKMLRLRLFGNCQRRHMCESGGSCARSTRPNEHRCRARASRSGTNTAVAYGNKLRQNGQLTRAAKCFGCAYSAIASAGTCANPVAAVHTARAQASSVAAPAHRDRAQIPQLQLCARRAAAGSPCLRQTPRLCLIQHWHRRHIANPAASVHSTCAPPSSDAAPTHHDRANAP